MAGLLVDVSGAYGKATMVAAAVQLVLMFTIVLILLFNAGVLYSDKYSEAAVKKYSKVALLLIAGVLGAKWYRLYLEKGSARAALGSISGGWL